MQHLCRGQCVANILTIRSRLVAAWVPLTEYARFNLHSPPIRFFDWRRSIRKPNSAEQMPERHHATWSFWSWIGTSSYASFLSFFFFSFLSPLDSLPLPVAGAGLALVDETTLLALVAFAALEKLALDIDAAWRATCLGLFLCHHSATYYAASRASHV